LHRVLAINTLRPSLINQSKSKATLEEHRSGQENFPATRKANQKEVKQRRQKIAAKH